MRTTIRRGDRPRTALAAIATAALTLLSCGPEGGAPLATATKVVGDTIGGLPASTVKSAVPASLGELPEAVARLEALREEVATAIVVDDSERRATEQLEAALRRVGRVRQRVEQLPFDELVELSRRLAATERSVSEIDAVVSSRLRRVEEDGRKVDELGRTFEDLANLAGRTAAPPAIRLRTGICRAQLDDLAAQLTRRRTDILGIVDKLAEARGSAAAMRAAMESQLVTARRQFSAAAEEPIWNLRFPGREALAATADRVARDTRRVRRWADSNGLRLLLLSVLFLGGTVGLLHRLRPGATRRAATDPAAAAILRIMESPLAAGIPVTVLALIAFSPQAPLVVYDLAWLVAAPAAGWVVTRMLGPRVSRTVWVLAASLALTPVTSALADLHVALRLAMLLQTAPLAVVLALDLHGDRFAGHGIWGRAGGLLKAVAWLLVACLGVAAAGTLLGWVGLATILSSGALGTLGGTILVLAANIVLSGLIRNLLASGPAQRLLMIRKNADLVAGTFIDGLRFVSVVAVLAISVRAFGVGFAARTLVVELLGARALLGAISISPGSIVGFVLVLWISVLLSRLVGFLLAEEILPRLDLRRGTAIAISGTTRTLVVFAGFVLASGAAGVDLSKFGFLAGALGVGIGFGLQNIVSNFISGLILLFERPIQVGDAVEVSGASGTVTQIGIRASTVHTFDGADVIVPNADLISKSVTNWTGSNPNRRFDVPVGVAYGSPLETTAQALLAAARRTPGILSTTAPEAFFQKFGDSSLDWTLRVWVRMDESPKALSDLRRAVSEELEKAGLEVPFPQRDLHLRSVTPEAGEALDSRKGSPPP